MSSDSGDLPSKYDVNDKEKVDGFGSYKFDKALLPSELPSSLVSLFTYVDSFIPQEVPISLPLKPFIPDWISATGSPSTGFFPPRPDAKEDDAMGFQFLAEPALLQSDPVMLDLQLRMLSKTNKSDILTVRSIEDAHRNPQAIDRWIQNITELYEHKPAPTVNYSKSMPDIDELMQEWPDGFEDLLKQVILPSAEMDMPLEDFARLVCNILDIPVHSSATIIQSLHVFFTLYHEFKHNAHFVGPN